MVETAPKINTSREQPEIKLTVCLSRYSSLPVLANTSRINAAPNIPYTRLPNFKRTGKKVFPKPFMIAPPISSDTKTKEAWKTNALIPLLETF